MVANDQPILKLSEIQLTLSGKTCLSSISAEFNAEGITAIIGPNGSGKTLLLKVISGLTQPTAGKTYWREPLTPPEITWVPQQPVLLNRSVEENLRLPLLVNKQKNNQQQIEQALQWANLSHLKKCPALQLSSGEKQLVALARAWVLNPRVILLDEPSANLDTEKQVTIDKLIKTLSESGCKVFLSSHNPQQIQRLATDIVLLDCGKLAAQLDKEAFFSSEYYKPVATL